MTEPEISSPIRKDGKQLVFSPSRYEPQMGYSRGIRVGNQIFVAGTTAIDANGKACAEDVGAQTDYVIRKIQATLRQLGGELHHVVSTVTHLTDLSYFDDYARMFQKYFGDITPVNTTVQAPLLRPDLLVEITATAVLVQSSDITSSSTS
ncbi:RidA family protein [Verrucosispora sp. TAA-831]|uniref:RidA family protein n=1 Tax=Verrucosispora sp. TAA-831 TaxID=3422227 RepID=UPI003D6F3C70